MEYKIVLIGNSFVGKTCIVNRAVRDTFDQSISTAGAFYVSMNVGNNVKLNIWDTAGSEKYKSVTPMYYREANIIMLVYSVNSIESFGAIEQWYQSVKNSAPQNVILILVGNKSDLEVGNESIPPERSSEAPYRTISYEQGKELAKQMEMHFFEVSAKTGDGVREMFEEAPRLYDEEFGSMNKNISENKNINVDHNNGGKCHC